MNVVTARTPAEESLNTALPHRRMEDWRWTDLRQLVDRPYPAAAVIARESDIDRLLKRSPLAGISADRMVFVNGRFNAKRSKLANGGAAPGDLGGDPLVKLNAAATGGARLFLSGNANRTIELVFVATDGEERSVALRNVIEIEGESSATLVETYLGEGSYLSNPVTEIRLGRGASLDRIKIEHESPDAVHLSAVKVTLAENSVLRDLTLTSGAKLNRQNSTYEFVGAGANAKVAGAYLISGRQHADTRLIVDHRVPNCTSRELFKCVIGGTARGIFQGKVIVRPDAQKTDGKQSSHALLLSETAEFDAKPELEIFADDVVCGHGATAGDIDHDHLFYLRSRGIPEAAAKSLLIAAFAGEAFESISHDGLREALNSYAAAWLTTRRAAA